MFANVVGAFPASRVFVWQWKWTHPNLYGPCFPSAVLFQQHLLWRQEESTVTFLSILKLQQQLLCDRKSKSSTPFLVDWTFYERKWLVKASVGACEYFSIISHIKNSKTPTHENKVGTGLMLIRDDRGSQQIQLSHSSINSWSMKLMQYPVSHSPPWPRSSTVFRKKEKRKKTQWGWRDHTIIELSGVAEVASKGEGSAGENGSTTRLLLLWCGRQSTCTCPHAHLLPALIFLFFPLFPSVTLQSTVFECKMLEEEFKNKPNPMFILDATCLSWPRANFQRTHLREKSKW